MPTASRTDLTRQREVIEAFLAAIHAGDFGALLEVLDPDVVRRVDVASLPGASREVRGAQIVAKGALALVNGNVGIVAVSQRRLSMAVTFRIREGKIVEIDLITSPARLRQLDLAVLND